MVSSFHLCYAFTHLFCWLQYLFKVRMGCDSINFVPLHLNGWFCSLAPGYSVLHLMPFVFLFSHFWLIGWRRRETGCHFYFAAHLGSLRNCAPLVFYQYCVWHRLTRVASFEIAFYKVGLQLYLGSNLDLIQGNRNLEVYYWSILIVVWAWYLLRFYELSRFDHSHHCRCSLWSHLDYT